MNSDRKELLKTTNKIRTLIMDLKFVNPKLPNGLRLLYTNDIFLTDMVRFKLKNPRSLMNKYILVDDCLNKVLAIYHTTNDYTLFKIKNIKYGKETKANWLKLLSMFELNPTNPILFDDLHCELRLLYQKLNELSMQYERLNDNVLYEEKGKVENLLKLCKDIVHLRARPKTQKLLDAFHKIESKYKQKGLGKGIKYPF